MPRITHFDIPADDPARAQKFYKKVFDWKFEKWDGPMDYYTSGLVLVAGLLMIQNIVIVVFWFTLYMDDKALMMSADMVSQYLFAINVIQTIGLSILVWITRR